jgi:hypothetical protein
MTRRSGRPTFALLVLLVAAGGGAATAAAGTFAGSATTAVRAFDLVQQPIGDQQAVRSYRPLDQSVVLGFAELGRAGRWSVDVSLRGRVDLATGRSGGEDDFDVLVAQARWRSRADLLHLTVGRQQSITGLGWRVFDGVRADFPKLRRADFFLFAGLPQEPFENGTPDLDSFTWGAGAAVRFPGLGRLGFDGVVRRFEDRTTEETVGLDLDLKRGRTSFGANADYSVLLDRFGETAVVLSRELPKGHGLEARWTRVEPVFSADSVWAVFASNPYDELRLSWDRRGPRGLDLGAFVSAESYEDTELPGEQDFRRAAFTVAWTGAGTRRASHRGEAGWQDGFSGSRLGGRYDVDADVVPRVRVGGGASIHRYENLYRLTDADQTVSLRARVAYDHFGRWTLAVEAQQLWGRDRDTLRGSLVFSAKLGAARRERPWWGDPWGPAWGGGVAPRGGAATEAVE